MLDYFLSSDWAIIATELLAGFIVISLVLAILVWRGQRRHTGAAERLLDDRDPILRASEEMLDRQIQRTWPELTIGDEQRESYAERSLDAVEAMVEPWLEPKRYELAAVARQFLQVRQADLDQLLTLARAHAEQSASDDPRLGELESDVKELREQRDRQAKHLAESLETVNVMVREYGRKFDYNDEPHVATVLKAIVMVQEMDAGADCETAKHRADEVFSEDLVATASPPADESDTSVPTGEDSAEATTEESGDEPADQPAEQTTPDEEPPALSAEDEMAAAMAAEGVSNEKTDAMQAAAQQLEEQATAAAASEEEASRPDSADHSEADDRPAQPTTDKTDTDTEKPAVDAAVEQQDASPDTGNIDQLIDSAAQAQSQAQPETIDTGNADETTQADEAKTTAGAEESDMPSGGDEPRQEQAPPSPPDGEDEAVAAQPAVPERQDDESESPEPTEARQKQRREDGQEEGENGVIDLDDVEIPKEEEKDGKDGKDQEFDLDDIDALLDAEIARKHGQGSE